MTSPYLLRPPRTLAEARADAMLAWLDKIAAEHDWLKAENTRLEAEDATLHVLSEQPRGVKG